MTACLKHDTYIYSPDPIAGWYDSHCNRPNYGGNAHKAIKVWWEFNMYRTEEGNTHAHKVIAIGTYQNWWDNDFMHLLTKTYIMTSVNLLLLSLSDAKESRAHSLSHSHRAGLNVLLVEGIAFYFSKEERTSFVIFQSVCELNNKLHFLFKKYKSR